MDFFVYYSTKAIFLVSLAFSIVDITLEAACMDDASL